MFQLFGLDSPYRPPPARIDGYIGVYLVTAILVELGILLLLADVSFLLAFAWLFIGSFLVILGAYPIPKLAMTGVDKLTNEE